MTDTDAHPHEATMEDPTDEVARFDQVSLAKEGTTILSPSSFRVFRRDFLGIIGPNGGGKTTLLRLLLGFEAPTSGAVTLLGGAPAATRHRVGYVPQFFTFDPSFPIDVTDTVLLGRTGQRGLFRRFSREDRRRAAEAMERVGVGHLARRPLGVLSGGEKQRVLIARALVTDPEVLVLDEPTASVDAETSTRLYELLAELHRAMPLIMVSHDLAVISSHVTRILCVYGKVHVHESNQLDDEIIRDAYGCPVDLIAHGHPHRVLAPHLSSGGEHHG